MREALVGLLWMGLATAAELGPLPATFQGKLPCADCPGIAYHLNLFADQSYFLRMTYLERNTTRDEVGRWVLANGIVELKEGGEKFAVERGGLRKLDRQGQRIDSKLDYKLRRMARLRALEPNVKLSGLFQYMADAPSFANCETGRRFAVAMEQGYQELERVYSKYRKQPGEQLMAEVEGQLAMRPKMDGGGKEISLVVTKFLGVFPGETCGQPFATANLRDTYWKVTRVGGDPVVVPDGRREPHLQFRTQESRLTGFDGCNSFAGIYEVNGDEIKMGPVAGTLMACLPGMNYEGRILKGFDQVRRWRIHGEHLELLGADGSTVLRLESRYMK